MNVDVDNYGNIRLYISGEEIRLHKEESLFKAVLNGQADSFLKSYIFATLFILDLDASCLEGDDVGVSMSEDNDIIINIMHEKDNFFTDSKYYQTDIDFSQTLYLAKRIVEKVNEQLKEIEQEKSHKQNDSLSAFILISMTLKDFIAFSKMNLPFDKNTVIVKQNTNTKEFFIYVLVKGSKQIPFSFFDFFEIKQIPIEFTTIEEHINNIISLEELSKF